MDTQVEDGFRLLWPLLFLIAAATYAAAVLQPGPRTTLVLVLVGLWALRLASYLTWRNWGAPEDRRYQVIRPDSMPSTNTLDGVHGMRHERMHTAPSNGPGEIKPYVPRRDTAR